MDIILNNIVAFDHRVQDYIMSIRSNILDSFFFFITNFGVWYIILGLFICFSCLFYYYSKTNLIWPFAVILLSSGITAFVIKFLTARDRPSLDLALYAEKLPSLPSAHAALIIALCGFLIFCLWKYTFILKLKIVLTIFLALMIILVGFSRIYLGVHYSSDVVAGYLVGLMWLLITLRFI